MKVSIVGSIGRSQKLPHGFAFAAPPDNQMTDPVKLRFKWQYAVKNQSLVPALRKQRLWVFRNKVVRVENVAGESRNEIVTRIKHTVLSEEKAFVKIAKAVELFEDMDRALPSRRVPISSEVRVFVWRRDGGKCVMCGSQERLEFDHVSVRRDGGRADA